MTVRPRTNFYLDAVLFILMVVVVVSGLVLWIVLPSGGEGNQPEGESRGRRWQTETTAGQPAEDLAPVPAAADNHAERTLAVSRQAWKLIHNWLGLGIGVAVLVHLVFHWKWLVCRLRVDVMRRGPGRSTRPTACQE